MRRNVTFVITLLVMALAAIGVTSLANAQSIFLPSLSVTRNDAAGAAVDKSSSEQPAPVAITPRPPVEITDLVPDLPDEQKTQVVFENEDGNQTSFYVAYRDHDMVNELILQYGVLIAILEPVDRGYPENPNPTGEPVPTSDPNFVHPEIVMPPPPPTQSPELYELVEKRINELSSSHPRP